MKIGIKGIKILVPALLLGGCGFTHRRVVHAWLNGEPMPKAPKWHCWVKPKNRRG
jgi:hypothetical protein